MILTNLEPACRRVCAWEQMRSLDAGQFGDVIFSEFGSGAHHVLTLQDGADD